MRIVKSVEYVYRKPSVKEALNEKMKVIKELYIVDKNNEQEIREQLQAEINAHPEKDYEQVLDTVARTLIDSKFK